MSGGAAGGFVTRSFESMLKECPAKKYPDLRKAIQAYIDNTKGVNQQQVSSKTSQAESGDGSLLGSKDGAGKGGTESDAGRSAGTTITTALASAGNTLEGAQVELVLDPLRLAFETKNLKVVEPALDCLHKLIAYNHLEGDPGLDGGKNATLFTDNLNMVCNCVDNSSPDSTILHVLKVLLTAIASTKFRVHGEPLLEVIRVCYNIALNSKSPINQATSKAMLTQMISIVFRRMEIEHVGTSIDAAGQTEAVSPENRTSKVEATSEGKQNEREVSVGDTPNQTKDSSLASVEELHSLAGCADIKGLEAVLDQVVHLEDGKRITRGIDLESVSIGHHDALLVFRTICKMGMKEGNDEVTTKTIILSLELLQGLLEGVCHSLTKNFHFIDSVKAYLSYALLRASISQSPVIFQYATGIFSVLLLRFRESLKGEIGVLFPMIVLRPLDGSEINRKMSILRMLDKVSKEPQMLVDIFVNYDCDPEAPNLFERMVTTLSKMAQGTQNADPNSVAMSQTTSVKGTSLQSLVNVLNSLVDWEKSQRDSEERSKRTQSLDYDVSSSEITEIKNSEEAPNECEKPKAPKSTMEAAISEFNRNPVKGVEYLISNNLVENTPSSVAQFLRNTPPLDKAKIGDYMGLNENFPLAVMHSYMDSMSFAGMQFDTAIREFLNGFRLPGEAEKIDRMIEKFAERYCADNPDLSKNADTAYVLAYAVILLNADAHNPMVWPKMSKSDFVRMNAMNDTEDCVTTELLEEIYDSVVREEIQMKDDITDILKSSSQKPEGEERSRLFSIVNMVLPKTKSRADTKSESEAIIKQTQAIFKNHGVKRGVFYTSQRIDLVRPMVEAVGWALLATFSVTMEEGDNNKPRVILLMEGFKSGIHITYVLGMDTMRYASLTSLVRFTFLHAPKEMRGKNVEALRTLLSLCDSEPESLQDTWNAVLGCVSRLEYITSTPSISATVMQSSNQISRDGILQSLRELAGKPVDKVFANSLKLPSDSVVEFFTALCGVSAEELKQTPARIFSLQKLVETSYYNMARIRLVWARIWSVLANHFIAAGRHHEEKIAMYSIDSLRQLSIKYLGRAELANFTFQNDILKPFVLLMRNSQRESIRRLILECIVQMIKSKVGNIRSGWHSVFMVFTAAADDELESIVESAFENVELVVLEHFDQVVGDCFMDCVNCLIRFANNKTSHRISLKAIALLRICEDRLAEGLISVRASNPIDADADTTFDVTEHYWFPMLAGLSDLTSDTRSEVRSCALEVLFDLLDERGSKFSSSFWESIFHRVLFPIFDHVRHAEKENVVPSGDEWLRETSIHALQLLCNVFNTFYKEVSLILPSLLSLLLDCAKKTDQTVVSISMGALVHLIEVGGHQFNEGDWDTLLKSIRDASYTTQPVELLNASDFENHQIQTVLTSGDTTSLMSAEDVNAYNGQFGAGDEGKLSSSTYPSTGAEDSAANPDTPPMLDQGQDLNESEDLPSSPGGSQKSAESGILQRNQTLGQRIMGNMMENLFLRNLTSKHRSSTFDAQPQPAPVKLPEPEVAVKEESPLMGTVRSKCITQSLLLGTLDTIQKKFWTKLQPSQKVAIMEIVLSLLEFAASYNSYANLRLRMRHVPADRPPFNLLRQELAGTSIYLDILQKATFGINKNGKEHSQSNGSQDIDVKTSASEDTGLHEDSYSREKLEGIAEGKLVSFCEHVLREACTFQSSVGDANNMDIHRVVELRSPVIIKVLKGMCSMNNQIFRRHLREFYPLLTKLVCCDQMDVRGALGDLFNAQLKTLLPP